MRKGFTFYYSYYSIFSKLTTDKQRSEFIAALLRAQFLELAPNEIDLSGDPLLDIAFEGVRHSIDASVQGYLNKAKPGDYKGIYEKDLPPCQGVANTPCQQEKEEEKEKEEEEEKEQYTKSERVDLHRDIISDLNEVCGKNFSHKTSTTQTAINGRLNEGYGLDDFKYVHRIKFEEWGGTKQEQYLRPATLYQPGKFEAYLQQKPKSKLSGDGIPEQGSLAWYAAKRGDDLVAEVVTNEHE